MRNLKYSRTNPNRNNAYLPQGSRSMEQIANPYFNTALQISALTAKNPKTRAISTHTSINYVINQSIFVKPEQFWDIIETIFSYLSLLNEYPKTQGVLHSYLFCRVRGRKLRSEALAVALTDPVRNARSWQRWRFARSYRCDTNWNRSKLLLSFSIITDSTQHLTILDASQFGVE
jgi:hypothetical protein